MYVTDVRQTDVRQKHRLMPPPSLRGQRNNNYANYNVSFNMCISQMPTQKILKFIYNRG